MRSEDGGSTLDGQTLGAFAAIYILWGSTFLAIRILVQTTPVLLAAGLRFAIAGVLLFLWARLRRTASLTRLEWRNVTILGFLLFLLPYAGLFWAEKAVPSGVAAVLVATIPLFTLLIESASKKQSLPVLKLGAVGVGLVGVVVVARGRSGSDGRFELLPCLAALGSSLSWSLGTVVSKTLALPPSKVLSAGAQMMCGGLFLLSGSAVTGELSPSPHLTPSALWALVYLIVFGSVVSFTSYIWLLGHMPASKVSSYAYVNPVVALLLRHWLGREEVGASTLWGSALILISVMVLLTSHRQKVEHRRVSN